MIAHKNGMTLNDIKRKLSNFTKSGSLRTKYSFKLDNKYISFNQILKPLSSIVITKKPQNIRRGELFYVRVLKNRALDKIKSKIHFTLQKCFKIDLDIEDLTFLPKETQQKRKGKKFYDVTLLIKITEVDHVLKLIEKPLIYANEKCSFKEYQISK